MGVAGVVTVAVVEFEGKELEKELERFMTADRSYLGYDVGFLKGRYAPKGKMTDPPTVAEVAVDNEFGTLKSGGRVPPRPFFRQANKLVEPKLIALLKVMLNDQNNFSMTSQLVKMLGSKHVFEVKKRINDLDTPPNAPQTLKEKYPETTPLIHTRLMRNSVTFKVVKKGQE